MTNQMAWPCINCRSIERAKSELQGLSDNEGEGEEGSTHLTKAGLMVRAIQIMVWLMPFELPSDSLFGVANLTSIIFKLGACQWISDNGKMLFFTRESY